MRRSREMTSSYRVGFSYCQWPSINLLLTIRWKSPDSFRTALTQCASWCVYLMAFVRRQPSARSTPPVDPRLDDTLETEAGARWVAGRSSNAGTLANGLTEMRSSPVSSDIKVRFKVSSEHYVTSVQTRFPRSSTGAEQVYKCSAHASRSLLIRKLNVEYLSTCSITCFVHVIP